MGFICGTQVLASRVDVAICASNQRPLLKPKALTPKQQDSSSNWQCSWSLLLVSYKPLD